MRATLSFAALFVFAASAGAAPIQLTHQARVVDATGEPLSGPVTLTVSLHADAGQGASIWSEQTTLIATDGYVQVVLGADPQGNPLHDTDFDGSPRYLALSIGQTQLGLRQLLATVPDAVMATHVVGGFVSAPTVRVGNDPDVCPDGASAGTLRWNAADDQLELCDGTQWGPVGH